MDDVKKEVKKLLKKLGKSLNLPHLDLDDNNHCILLFDEKLVLNIELNEPKEALVIYAYLGEVPLENREVIFERLLEANAFWNGTNGATFGIDKQSQTLVLAYALELPLRHPETFEENLANFVETVEKWSSTVEHLVQEVLDAQAENDNYPPSYRT